nr:TolC family protein [uncultured Desulfobacter sp.]
MNGKQFKYISGAIIALALTIPSLTAVAMAQTTEKKPISVNRAVELALEKNKTLAAADQVKLGAEEGVKSSRADLFAKASLDAGYTGLRHQPIMKIDGRESASAHDNQYSWGVTLSQPLFTGYKLSSRVDLAKLNVVDADIQRRLLTIDLARDVKLACYNLLLTKKLLEVAQSEVDSLTSHRRRSLNMYKQELIPKNDLLRSEVALANSLQALEQAKADVDSARALLNTLMDEDVDFPVTVKDIIGIPEMNQSRVQLNAYALENRPDLHGIKNNIEQAALSEKLAKSGYYPDVNLVGRYEQASGELSSLENDYTNSENASISLEMTWTFFEWGKTSAQIREARHQKESYFNTLRARENQVRQDVKDALLTLGVAKKNIKTAQTSMDQAIENYRITNEQYFQQVVTSTIVIDAQSYLTQASSNYYRSLYGYMASLATLDWAIGKI